MLNPFREQIIKTSHFFIPKIDEIKLKSSITKQIEHLSYCYDFFIYKNIPSINWTQKFNPTKNSYWLFNRKENINKYLKENDISSVLFISHLRVKPILDKALENLNKLLDKPNTDELQNESIFKLAKGISENAIANYINENFLVTGVRPFDDNGNTWNTNNDPINNANDSLKNDNDDFNQGNTTHKNDKLTDAEVTDAEVTGNSEDIEIVLPLWWDIYKIINHSQVIWDPETSNNSGIIDKDFNNKPAKEIVTNYMQSIDYFIPGKSKWWNNRSARWFGMSEDTQIPFLLQISKDDVCLFIDSPNWYCPVEYIMKQINEVNKFIIEKLISKLSNGVRPDDYRFIDIEMNQFNTGKASMIKWPFWMLNDYFSEADIGILFRWKKYYPYISNKEKWWSWRLERISFLDNDSNNLNESDLTEKEKLMFYEFKTNIKNIMQEVINGTYDESIWSKSDCY